MQTSFHTRGLIILRWYSKIYICYILEYNTILLFYDDMSVYISLRWYIQGSLLGCLIEGCFPYVFILYIPLILLVLPFENFCVTIGVCRDM